MYEVIKSRLKSAERMSVPVSVMKAVLEPDAIHMENFQSYESIIIDCAEMLEATLRPDDSIGRMGIFEFLIVLGPQITPDVSNYEAGVVAISHRLLTSWNIAQKTPLRLAHAQSFPGDRAEDLLNRLDG